MATAQQLADLLSPRPMKFKSSVTTSWAASSKWNPSRLVGIMLISVIASAAKVFGYLFNESETHAAGRQSRQAGPWPPIVLQKSSHWLWAWAWAWSLGLVVTDVSYALTALAGMHSLRN